MSRPPQFAQRWSRARLYGGREDPQRRLHRRGRERAEAFFHVDNLYHPDNFQLVYGVDNALKAHALFRRDKDYVLMQEGKMVSAGERLNPKLPVEVVIVDEFTGRLMEGRRYSEGLHEAIEAKEGIRVRGESQTFATITIQNYFRLYPKLAGMTGTALTEAEEFYQDLQARSDPHPHAPADGPPGQPRPRLQDRARQVPRRGRGDQGNARGGPPDPGRHRLHREVGRASQDARRAQGCRTRVLNAKQHEREASIVAQAGQHGAVTIATNMAGRGTDIILGFGVAELGGLHIIGTERHESRRIDNQLRGRAGRQGDPGSSRFYVSLEDEIMRRSGVNQNIVNSPHLQAPLGGGHAHRAYHDHQERREGADEDGRLQLRHCASTWSSTTTW